MTEEADYLRNILVQKDEQINSLQQQMEIVMRHLSLNHYGVPPVHLGNPIGDAHNDERDNDAEIDDDDFLGPL